VVGEALMEVGTRTGLPMGHFYLDLRSAREMLPFNSIEPLPRPTGLLSLLGRGR
jgi:hypothetical protein